MNLRRLEPSSFLPAIPVGAALVFVAAYCLLSHSFNINEFPKLAEEAVATTSQSYSEKGEILLRAINLQADPDTEKSPWSTYTNDAIFRIVWANLLLAIVCCISFALGIALTTLARCLRGRARNLMLLLTILTGVGLAILVQIRNLSGGIGSSLYWIARAQADPALPVSSIMNWFMACVALTSWFTVSACSALCCASREPDEASQRLVVKLFKYNLGITAVFLCLGILQTFALYAWLCSFLPDPESAQLILSGMTLSVSFFYTVFFLIIFLPTYFVCIEGSRRWARHVTKIDDPETQKTFLDAKGIHFAPSDLLKLLSVLSSPLLIGLLTELFKPILMR